MPVTSPPGLTMNVTGSPATRHAWAVFMSGSRRTGEGEVEARDVWLDDGPRRTAIDGDGEHHEAARSILLPERFECRHLGGAGLTPRRPEVQDHELVLEVLQRGVAVRGERAELEAGPRWPSFSSVPPAFSNGSSVTGGWW